MSLTREQQNIEDFFAGVRGVLDGYRPIVTYLALRDGKEFVLVQGRLFLDAIAAAPPPRKRQRVSGAVLIRREPMIGGSLVTLRWTR